MIRILACVSALVFAMIPVVTRAQPTVISLDGAGVHKHASGTNLDLYRFVAAAGTKATIVVDETSGVMITLYTPEGAQMLHVEGIGKVALEAFLPASSAYIISVARASKVTPYTIELGLDEPTLAQAYLSQGVGYGSSGKASCWVDPGRVKKYSTDEFDLVGTVDAADHVSQVMTLKSGWVGGYQTRLVPRGDAVIAMNTYTGGLPDEKEATFDWVSDGSLTWKGYFCP